jgi:hypothetical protein
MLSDPTHARAYFSALRCFQWVEWYCVARFSIPEGCQPLAGRLSEERATPPGPIQAMGMHPGGVLETCDGVRAGNRDGCTNIARVCSIFSRQ